MINPQRFAVAHRVDRPYAHRDGRAALHPESVDFVFHDGQRHQHGAIVGTDHRGAAALATRLARAADDADIRVDYVTASATPIASVADFTTRLSVGERLVPNAAGYYFDRARECRSGVASHPPTLLILDGPAALFGSNREVWGTVLGGLAGDARLSVVAIAPTLSLDAWGESRLRDQLTADHLFHLRDEPTTDDGHFPRTGPPAPGLSLLSLPEPGGRFSYGYALTRTSRMTPFAVDTEQA